MSRIITFSTIFTLLRILMTPFVVREIVRQHWSFAFCLFVCAALTDFIDGFIARRYHQVTFLGTVLDPIADKIFLVACYASLAYTAMPAVPYTTVPYFKIPLWFVIIVGMRELILLGAACYGLCAQRGITIKPNLLGKGTTALQSVFIGMVLICYFFDWYPYNVLQGTMMTILLFLLLSFVQYVITGILEMRCFSRGH